MKQFLILSLIFIILSCGSESNMSKSPSYEPGRSTQAEDIISREKRMEDDRSLISSVSTLPFLADSGLKLVKTADIKFKTDDMLRATRGIEDIVLGVGGYVAQTYLSTEILNNSTYPITKDTLLRTLKLQRVNNFTLRIPSDKLHESLRAMAEYMSLLHHRNIDVENVSLKLKAEELKRKRLSEHRIRLAKKSSQASSQNLEDITEAEESLLRHQEDNATLQSMELEDKLKYSEVTLYVYQAPTLTYNKEAIAPNIPRYTKPYSSKLGEGFMTGLQGLAEFFVGVITLWPLWLFSVLIWAGARKFLRKK